MPSDSVEEPLAAADLGDRPFGRATAAVGPDGSPAERWRHSPERVAEVGDIDHPHLARPLDAGADAAGPFAVFAPFAGESLAALVRDIGPMPSALAERFTRQAADALAAVHARGLVHGDVRLGTLVVGPLVESSRTRADGSPLRRPADDAAVTLYALGFAAGDPTADWTALGEALFEMLAGRPPLPGEPIAEAREADLPPELVALHDDLRAGKPVAAAWVATPYHGPSDEHKFVLPDAAEPAFSPPADASTPPPAKEWTDADRRTLKRWLYVGAGLWGLALLLWYVFLAQSGCAGDPPPADDKPAKKKRT